MVAESYPLVQQIHRRSQYPVRSAQLYAREATGWPWWLRKRNDWNRLRTIQRRASNRLLGGTVPLLQTLHLLHKLHLLPPNLWRDLYL